MVEAFPGRMLFSRVGVSKLCFLLSLAFCAFLLLLIPGLQLPLRHVEIPKPQPHSRAPGGDAGRPGQLLGLTTALHLNVGAPATGDAGATPPSRTLRSGGGDASSSAAGSGGTVAGNEQNSFQALDGEARGAGPVGSHLRDQLQLADIFIAVKTTKKYHKSRLELLVQTWVSKAKEQVGNWQWTPLSLMVPFAMPSCSTGLY